MLFFQKTICIYLGNNHLAIICIEELKEKMIQNAILEFLEDESNAEKIIK